MRGRLGWRIWLAAGLLLAGTAGQSSAVIVASSADDICGPAADPCVITQTVKVADGSVLDFGTRAVEIRSGGQLDFGTGFGKLSCGALSAVVSGTALKLRGSAGDGSSAGGFVIVEVRRSCSGDPAVTCFTDADCGLQSAGLCTSGSGAVLLDGKVLGSADDPATFLLTAAGDIDVLKPILLNSTSLQNDGGSLDLASTGGQISLQAKVQAQGGAQGTGGDVCILAAGDLVVSQAVDVSGGDFDGGIIDLAAAGSVFVSNDIIADANSGEGFGGEIDIDAGVDLVIVGGSGTNRLRLTTSGHQSAENFAGDGGPQNLTAGREIHVGPFVRARSIGAAPDGFGEDLLLEAGGDVLIEGDIESTTRGTEGGAGALDVFAQGNLRLAASASIDLSGKDGGGGFASFTAGADCVLDGAIDVSASATGLGGSIDVACSGDTSAGGTMAIDGVESGTGFGWFEAATCRVDLLPGFSLNNQNVGGVNRFIVGESMRVADGAVVRASGSGGSNVIVFRDAAKPPVLAGLVDPPPLLNVEPSLVGCPVCGNSEIDQGESCDDGNSVGGDGCSSDCQDEGCIADTPGYPSVALCDDGNGCTADRCDVATSSCEHLLSCDDGIACTVDTCQGTVCLHSPDDTACEDGNPCTDDICGTVGCLSTTNTAACDDGLFCNGADVCSGGSCSAHAGDPCSAGAQCAATCNEAARNCFAPAGTLCSDDANVCTDDLCDGLGSCVHPANTSVCEDGLFCNGADFCADGGCSVHAGDPCSRGAQCADSCNEIARNCFAPDGTSCIDDANVCTDDVCDGAGSCNHPPNSAACDDGDLCTLSESCMDGRCAAMDERPLSFTSLLLVLKPGAANDRFVIKAKLPSAALSTKPSETGVRVELRDTGGSSYSAWLPASSVTNVGGKSRVFKFRDRSGAVASANGIQVAVFSRADSKGIVKIKAKMKRFELPGAFAQATLSASFLFGTDPAADDCATGRNLSCRRKRTKNICSG